MVWYQLRAGLSQPPALTPSTSAPQRNGGSLVPNNPATGSHRAECDHCNPKLDVVGTDGWRLNAPGGCNSNPTQVAGWLARLSPCIQELQCPVQQTLATRG